MIKSKQYVQVYEVDGHETPGIDKPAIEVSNHWSSYKMVHITLPDGKVYTVVGTDIMTAIANALNVNR